MLVLSRLRDESIEIGSRTHALVPLAPDELEVLSRLASETQGRMGLAERLAAAVVGPVVVTVVAVRGDKVRIGFDAPRALDVHRTEVRDAIDRESWTPTPPPGAARVA